MTRAIVIRTVGDIPTGDAIIDGMRQTIIPVDDGEMEAIKAEFRKLKAKTELRAHGDRKRFEEARQELEDKYYTQPHGRLYNAILGVWGLVCFKVYEFYRKMQAWNREA